MSVIIEAIRVSSPDFRAETVDHLLGNILEPVTIEVDCRFELFVEANAAEPVEAGSNVPNTSSDDWFFDAGLSGRFNDFLVGDTIVVTSAGSNNGTYTILAKNGPNLIQVDTSLTAASHTTAFFDNTTSIGGCTFKSAFIENNEGLNFDSKETLDQQVWTSDQLDSTNTVFVNMVPQGSPEWQIGTVKVKGQNVVGVESFTIKIETFIHPFFLAGQLVDLQSGIAPDYFLSNAALKHVFDVGLQPSLRNPNRIYNKTVSNVLGNTGWFDENFNGLPTNYFIDSVAFTKVSDSSPLTALELTGSDQTHVVISMKNTVDTPFIDWNVDAVNGTPFLISFTYLPTDTALYRNTGNVLIDNFYFDQAKNQAGNPALTAGFRDGTPYQVIKNLTSTFVSSSEVTVEFDVNLGATTLNGISIASDRNYALGLSVQDSLLTPDVSDRVQLLVNSDEFIFDPTNSNSITFGNKFLVHPQNSLDDGQFESTFLPEDNVVARTLLQLDNSLGELITAVSVDLLVVKNTGEEFTLESFDQVLPTNVIVNGAQNFTITIPKSLKIPAGEIRGDVVIQRRTDLDTPPVYAFEVAYPFTIRWEDWVALAGVNSDFFNTSEANDGFNQEWPRYNDDANWQICLRVTANVNQDGTLYQSTQDFFVDTRDYDLNPDWGVDTIKTFDPDTLTQLIDGGDEFVLGYKDTKVEVEFDYIGASPPDVGDVWFIIRMEVFEQGGVTGITRLSNIYATDGNTFLKSIDDVGFPGIVKVTKVGNTYKGECLVDFTKLPAGETQYKISGRIGITSDPNCLLTEDGQTINLEDDSDCLEIES